MSAKVLSHLDKSNASVIPLIDHLKKNDAHNLEVAIKQWSIDPAKVLVFDFDHIHELSQTHLSMLVAFVTKLKGINKPVYSVQVPSVLHRLLQEKGLLRAFGVCQSLAELEGKLNPQSSAPAAKPKVDANVLRQFIEGACKAFEVQAGIKISPGAMTSKTMLFEPGDAIAGTVEVSTIGFVGSISLCFSEASFKVVYKALLDEELAVIDNESKDAAAELLNMIYGHAKTALNQQLGLQLKPAIPKVALNPVPVPSTQPVVVVPFQSSLASFRIEIQIQ